MANVPEWCKFLQGVVADEETTGAASGVVVPGASPMATTPGAAPKAPMSRRHLKAQEWILV
eukprot:10688540-Lingulodinium_polyedra.AAC.1